MVTFGVALMPLALLSYVQMRQYQQEAAARAEAAVLGSTMRAALPMIDQITRAEGAVAALAAAVSPLRDDPQACGALLRRFLAMPENHIYTFAGYIPRDRRMTCSPSGPRDLRGEAELEQVMIGQSPAINVNPKGPVSGTSVLILSHPVRDGAGQFTGVVAVSVPHEALEVEPGIVQTPNGPETVEIGLLTLSADDEVLTSNNGLASAAAHMPDNLDLRPVLDDQPRSFSAVSRLGERRIFAAVPLHSSGIHLLGSWPITRTDAKILEQQVPILIFPALMWLASLLIALLAAEIQVLRHIRKLRDTITQFSQGGRQGLRTDLHDAPQELKALGGAFNCMMSSVSRNESMLEDTIHQKEVLLREVHHRVKNNLQLIASIINMQIRKARSPETRGLLKSLQDRVMSLATIHRELYQTTGIGDIRADELLNSIVSQILKMAARPGEPFEVSTAIDEIRLTPDQAVPLSLLVTEALTNALKYASAAPGKRPLLTVTMTMRPDGLTEVRVRNSLHGGAQAPQPVLDIATEAAGLGEALVRAFAAQLRTTVIRRQTDDSYELSFAFAPSALQDAEERLQSR